VRHVFGIPGGPSIPYMEAMRKNGIEFVLVSNEQSAGMMADVCGRLTGIPGVCHATFGPGATNLATGVGGALLDRSPLIAFTTEVKAADIGRKVQMNIDHQALFRPLTKWTTRLSPGNFPETISRAFQIATAEMPGPVHVGLPSDIDGEPTGSARFDDCCDTTTPLPNPAALEMVAKLLNKAKKPILAIGLTAARRRLHPALRAFVDRNNIPVVLTPMAKGIISDSHPCYAGVLFHSCSEIVAAVYRQADLVVGIGYDSIEFNYESWLPQAPLVHIDTEPADVPADCGLVCEVVGDLAVSIDYLQGLSLPVYNWDLTEIGQNRHTLLQALHPATDFCSPSEMIVALRKTVPADGILTADVGAHLHLLGQLWTVREPQQFLMTNGWSSMGFGIPSAIGAKLCRPELQVVCVTGDGGFLMNCGELMTARRLGLNVVVVVLCDKNLSLIEVKQGWRHLPQYATGVNSGEYFAAESFLGVPVLKATNAGEMKIALQKAFSFSSPAIIEATVDGSVYRHLISRSYK
jgi:acetolactate synthase-1/2/3 large subunit